MFQAHSSFTSAVLGRPISLQRGHVDLATLSLTFVYFEHAQDEWETWHEVQDSEPLVVGQHYGLDARNGTIMLLDNPFWRQEGHWRSADRLEPLLYKNQVKWPQVILFEYEYYQPEEVRIPAKARVQGTVKIFREQGVLRAIDFAEMDEEALARLGYEVPKYIEAADDNV